MLSADITLTFEEFIESDQESKFVRFVKSLDLSNH